MRPPKISLAAAKEHCQSHWSTANPPNVIANQPSSSTKRNALQSSANNTSLPVKVYQPNSTTAITTHHNRKARTNSLPNKCSIPSLADVMPSHKTLMEPSAAVPISTPKVAPLARHNPIHLQSTSQGTRWRPAEADLHMQQVKQTLLTDKSKWRLRPHDSHLFEYLVLQLANAADMSNAVRTTKQDKQIWTGKWLPFCKRLGTLPWRNDHRVTFDAAVRLREGFLFCFFYLHCIQVTVPKDKTKSMCKPETAAANVRAVTRIFKRYGLPVVEHQFLKTVMRGICNLYVERHGPEAFMPQRKQPLTVEIIYKLVNVPEGTSLGPLGVVKYGSLLWDSLVAALQFAAQTGARAAEIGTDNNELTIADYTFEHVQWSIRKQMHATPTADALQALTSLDYASVRPTVSKADQRGEVWVPFPMHLHYRANAPINAARGLRQLELYHPPVLGNRSQTPLFRNNNQQPLTIHQLRTAFSHLIKAVLPQSEHNKSVFAFSLEHIAFLASEAPEPQGLRDHSLRLRDHPGRMQVWESVC